jgi:hypothetical protein
MATNVVPASPPPTLSTETKPSTPRPQRADFATPADRGQGGVDTAARGGSPDNPMTGSTVTTGPPPAAEEPIGNGGRLVGLHRPRSRQTPRRIDKVN